MPTIRSRWGMFFCQCLQKGKLKRQGRYEGYTKRRRKAIAKSIAECGQDANTSFKGSWIGFAHAMMKPGQIGLTI